MSLRARRSNRKLFLVILLILSSSFLCAQQVIEGKSGNYSFSITREVKPPILQIPAETIKFIEPGGNNIIDAGETCRIRFALENNGYGPGSGLTLRVNATGATQGILFSKSKSLDDLDVGKKADIEIPVSADLTTTDGSVLFSFKVDEPNGFGTDEHQLEVRTCHFISPMVEVVDYTVTGGRGGNLVKKVPFELQLLVQNTQPGKAEEVAVEVVLPLNVLLLSGKTSHTVPLLPGGETRSLECGLIVNDLFSDTTIPIQVRVKEKHGRYARDKTINLTLNQMVAASKIVVDGSTLPPREPEIIIASLTPPVDQNIPVTGITHPNRYALIIGNEDYSSRQTGLATEVNVDFAANDARIFSKYLTSTLGFNERQVHVLIDATAAEIRKELEWISNLSRLKGGEAELLFYYSGHGLPEETSREPYLIPVDVSGANLTQGIRLSEVYGKLTEHPAKRVTVFLDACFSGGARNQGLLAMKSVRFQPAETSPGGNMVVFTSSSGQESSGVNRDKKHGYFTWFLLKKIQETKGDVSYKELGDYLKREVSLETALISKPQTPQVLVSPLVEPVWETWNLK